MAILRANNNTLSSVTALPTGLGVTTPAFEVYQTSSQTPADNTYTKLTFTGESFDTDSAWADSKFTVPSGKAGKYVFY